MGSPILDRECFRLNVGGLRRIASPTGVTTTSSLRADSALIEPRPSSSFVSSISKIVSSAKERARLDPALLGFRGCVKCKEGFNLLDTSTDGRRLDPSLPLLPMLLVDVLRKFAGNALRFRQICLRRQA